MITENNTNIRKTYTVRYSDKERKKVQANAEAMKLPTSTYIRISSLSDDSRHLKRFELSTTQERKEYAQILAALGKSRISQNLNQIAYAINTGTLVLSPDVVSQITEACETLQWLRRSLIKKMGLRQ